MLYLNTAQFDFSAKWKRDWKSPKELAKIEPKRRTHRKTRKETKYKVCIERHKNSRAWDLEGQGYTRLTPMSKRSDHEWWWSRYRGCAGTNGRREPARDEEKTTGTRERCQIQMNIFWKGLLLFCQNFKIHLSRTFESIWQKRLKVPGRLWVRISLLPLTSCVSLGKKLEYFGALFFSSAKRAQNTHFIMLLGASLCLKYAALCWHEEIPNKL